jgi:hypothetical protein
MKKGRSTYPVQFNTDSNTINNLMQSYLNAENFKVHEKKGEQYFRAGDQMLGFRGLKYSINGQILTIEAWLDGALGDFPLEQNSLNMMAMNYRNSLSTLFQEIENLNGGNMMNNNVNNGQMNFDPNTGQPLNQNMVQQPMGQPVNQMNMQQQQNNFSQTFKNENLKKQETMCEIGFWISILGLLGSFAGIMMGLFVYILDFYFASQGLKTRKRGKAIATIVLSIVSILIVIIQLASA